ncbi:uncharacterized protein LOC113670930 [Pocillopora damicornis]|uniref:uncharacterized protein LOC113670930 n=1 Tax=Pocillopora damicornis TaxID=46731 RepID=UPI000F554945|nr:uncharacterized protein LOC113670930 [Pocillopora damicornis]
MLLAAISFLFLVKFGPTTCSTHQDSYFRGFVEDTILNTDWMTCLQACHNKASCISYNYGGKMKTCEMISDGVTNQCDSGKVIYSRGWVFHQIRPLPQKQVIAELGDSPSNPAESCLDILDRRSSNGSVKNGAYYIRIGQKTSLIYCLMENTLGCKNGGWTLAMKINGNKGTFSYSSDLWTNTEAYNPEEAKNLDEKETKFPFYAGAQITVGLCVGMKVQGHTRWLELKIPYKNTNLYGIFVLDSPQPLSGIDSSQWKSLINGSSMPENCSNSEKSGFNVHQESSAAGAKARLGLIARSRDPCVGDPDTRIGFGTAGSIGGTDPNNTCGNVYISSSGALINKSIKAFCYIFIK